MKSGNFSRDTRLVGWRKLQGVELHRVLSISPENFHLYLHFYGKAKSLKILRLTIASTQLFRKVCGWGIRNFDFFFLLPFHFVLILGKLYTTNKLVLSLNNLTRQLFHCIQANRREENKHECRKYGL